MSDDAIAADVDAQVLGEGEFPDVMNRPNWGALLLPGLWAFQYNLWRWFWAIVVLDIVGRFAWFAWVNGVPFGNAPSSPIVVAAVYFVLAGVGWSVSYAFARRASRAVWAKEQARRLAPTSGQLSPPQPVERFLATQLGWTLAGFAYLILGNAVGVFRNIDALAQPRQLWPFLVEVAVSLFFVALLTTTSGRGTR